MAAVLDSTRDIPPDQAGMNLVGQLLRSQTACGSIIFTDATPVAPKGMMEPLSVGRGRHGTACYFPCSSFARWVWKSAAFSASAASFSASLASAAQCFSIFSTQGFFLPPFGSGMATLFL